MKARRLASFSIDLLIAAAPWSALLGTYVAGMESHDVGMVAYLLYLGVLGGFASLALLTIQSVLFLRRGRTLGMGCTGLVVAGGSRRWSLVLGVLVMTVPPLVFVASSPLLRNLDVDEDTGMLIMAAIPFVSLALELFPAVAPGGRTLSDRIARIRWASDERPGVRHPHPCTLDLVVPALVCTPLLMPLLLQLHWGGAAGAVLGTAAGCIVFPAIEIVAVVTRRGTLALLVGDRPT